MKNIGRIVFYDNDTGDILMFYGEKTVSDSININIPKIDSIELPYGSIDYTRNRLIGINVETKEPILEEIKIELTEEEKKIQELENQLLIAENEKVGGIL
ncbi:TPA: hypothetical protein KPG21_003069 [Clostridioides difficile]|uniref:hypothetical protein n=1 Tax=Clostridioides difficile TaxID=1496 RepID=UPI000D1DB80C|nr:hypothetical protein [Clostridioides difficile]EGT5447401.1 hypothetical protein [Clostridioides difficile]MBH7250119.1 hypothetical protein [Clostridioides difficile]MBZ4494559.1 hypothetical protein [Clostridioides difficile]MCK1917523.1 hypothetical protein [Clostridioides difficile]MCL0943183.1 hypothetical protein [Clostridioides difficile]